MTVPPPLGPSTVLGYPRIGPRRELKRALEAYWDGRSTRPDLLATGQALRAASWQRLAALGLPALPSGTFSFYDHVLDTAQLVGAVPDRYRAAGADPLDTYFAMARGTDRLAPLRMTKWFDTNYHYLVPEIGESTQFRLAGDQPVAEVREARALGLATRPVLLGPVTFLLLAQPAPGSPSGFTPLDRLPDLLAVYGQLLAALAAEGVDWVQLDEPALVADRTGPELAAVRTAYRELGELPQRPRLCVATYFGELGPALPVLAGTPVEAVGLDLVRGRAAASRPELDRLRDKVLVAGVVSGRDVWRTDLDGALALLRELRPRVRELVVAGSCPLLHVPYDLARETELDPALRSRLAFAEQKVAELVTLADRLAHPAPAPAPVDMSAPTPVHPPAAGNGRSPYPVRAAAQAARLRLPPLPVTTIGSFPQTGELRAARAALQAGQLDQAGYEARVESEIELVVRLQERLGLDVLVHGEPERNDMVQYFAEHLAGFATTRHGWVQSYGSRCTRPPILHGDVHRPAPITVRWSRYAQSLTRKPVKGMLTGPVTIVAWSFVRPDLPLREVVGQVAEAVREEVADLEAAGISVIQVDEPALRELLPLRGDQQPAYLAWAVDAYRRATSGASDRTQIHTHLCYSDADQIVAAIDGLDADVTTVESARSGARLLAEPAVAGFPRGLGPGVYDIHSPRVPDAAEVGELLAAALRVLPRDRVWVNPDCGLKTRSYAQVEAALGNLVTAARHARAQPASPAH
ncbi:MAG: 5-methyltetrahydropteroyltriglutamate--homocysteine S-methyltransferase [Micromonosporaceae bacterium]|nr:5-methyltetrahydropteroyltriglutamate--homocysteine S-methyltransferase [Micromonosporaceae bacterium]